jgi:penicillin-binding protein 1C
MHRLEWVTPAYSRSAAQPLPPLRITYPDPGTTIALDPQLPPVAQQLLIDIETSGQTDWIDVYVDGVLAGSRRGSGSLAWAPVPGRHVLRAVTESQASEKVQIEVVPF